MAELGITIAEKLIIVTASAIIKDICEMWGYKSQLEDLNKTVSTIKNVLLDAEAKRELSIVAQAYIDDLKKAVYDADDLFDEFLTLAELKKLNDDSNKDESNGKLLKKVRRFFCSKKKEVSQAHRMSQQVKDIKKLLDGIASNHTKFGFAVDNKPISRRRKDTCSYVESSDIIGREHDKKAIVDMLLDANVNEDFLFVTIVGVGGLGKTALAQLVYNDEKVNNEFPLLRLWVCVSDQDGEKFDVTTILCKILELVSDKKPDDSCSLEWVQNQLGERLRGIKYLLVLDDVWNEDREEWLNLKKFLMFGQKGSRIIVTTRSEMTAKIIGDKHTYKLEGLSPNNSWRLFKMTSFVKDNKHKNHLELVKIGKNIVKKCHNIPLAIKVVGSLLFGQGISKWRSFEMSGLAEIGKGDNKIMCILKLSYHNLNSSLKSCFSYCALFPKDTEIERELLISLWIAQGYIMPFDIGQSIEDAAEEHFLILLRRCFFQDVERDEYGDIESVKIHDLMHDVALDVGRKEICVVSSSTNDLGDKTRHVSFTGKECVGSSLSISKIRSLIHTCQGHNNNVVVSQLDKCTCLRVLELPFLGVETSLNSLGKLMHLRCINLSYAALTVLPDSIVELHNLQALVLRWCALKELPKDFCKLVNLRHLDLYHCHRLTSMPSGFDRLTKLSVLPYFVVGAGKNNSNEKQCSGELKDLKALTNIKGDIHIKIGKRYNIVEGTHDEGGEYLKSMKHVREFKIYFGEGCVDTEALMEKLEPHTNLKGLMLYGYPGTMIRRWGRAEDNWAISLPNLVKIDLRYCGNLEQIPSLSKLPYLRSLVLEHLDKLEYMEDTVSCSNESNDGEKLTTFFPSLESLEIMNLNMLKGWWRRESLVKDDDQILRTRMRFPRLCILRIEWCVNLTSFPPCPSLEDLKLYRNNETLGIDMVVNTRDEKGDTTAGKSQDIKLRSLVLDNVGYLKAISSNEQLSITECDNNDDNEMPWKLLNQSLRSMELKSLKNTTNLPKGMQYLTSLQRLELFECEDLKVLPEWICCLSSLQSLSLIHCYSLKSLPESMRDLTFLQTLHISYCQDLQQRCKEPNGEDWPKIQHIPQIDLDIS